jgi:ABC-2 type transport system ATP-binding protein/lipopolysaccharide transport system ATP-binding protein
MAVRLGFALAVSVDPEILLADEILAVGDAAFKKRCFERMEAFIDGGKTIIVVTHNLQEIERIARRFILIDHGRIQEDGPPASVGACYSRLLSYRRPPVKPPDHGANESTEKPVIEIVDVKFRGSDGGEKVSFRTHGELRVCIRYVAHQPVLSPTFRVQIYRSDGLFCHGMNTRRHGITIGRVQSEGEISLRYLDLGLLQGTYSFQVAVLSTEYDELPVDQVVISGAIHVESETVDGGGVLAMPTEWILARGGSTHSHERVGS